MPPEELEGFLPTGKKRPFIYLAPTAACSGPRLALALDEAGENDTRIEQGGFAFCINNELLQQVKSVSIDANYLGFLVTPEVPLPSSGGSCLGSCCSTLQQPPVAFDGKAQHVPSRVIPALTIPVTSCVNSCRTGNGRCPERRLFPCGIREVRDAASSRRRNDHFV